MKFLQVHQLLGIAKNSEHLEGGPIRAILRSFRGRGRRLFKAYAKNIRKYFQIIGNLPTVTGGRKKHCQPKRNNMVQAKTIAIASFNPVKAEAVKEGFTRAGILPLNILTIEVESGVADQPMSDDETLTGALNRVKGLRSVAAEFRVGIEGGIQQRGKSFEAFAWAVIEWEGGSGKAKSASFELPPEVCRLILNGYELGAANDKVFGQINSKQKGGAVGLLTGNGITRTQLYTMAVQLALIPFLNGELYAK